MSRGQEQAFSDEFDKNQRKDPVIEEKVSSEDKQQVIRMRDIESSFDIPIPKDPLKRVIGQDFAIKIARIAAHQRRNLLLIGPPGIRSEERRVGKECRSRWSPYH